MYKEKNLTADFSAFLRKDPRASQIKFTFAVEMKLKRGNASLHLTRDFQPQQINALLQAARACIYHKMSDQTMSLKPFDSFQLCNVPAFVGVCWYIPRKKKVLYMVEVEQFEKWIEAGYNKVTEEEVKEKSLFTFDL